MLDLRKMHYNQLELLVEVWAFDENVKDEDEFQRGAHRQLLQT